MANPRKLKTLTGRKIGNWNGAIRFIETLGYNVTDAAVKGQWDEATNLKQAVQRHLLKQDLPWAPHAKSTTRQKTENKNLIYIETEKYLESLKVWKEGNRVFAGVKKGVSYKRRGGKVTVDQVGIWMEFGTRRMPARPVWGPTINELGGARGMRDRITDRIYRSLRRSSRGGPILITRGNIRRMFKANASIK